MYDIYVELTMLRKMAFSNGKIITSEYRVTLSKINLGVCSTPGKYQVNPVKKKIQISNIYK